MENIKDWAMRGQQSLIENIVGRIYLIMIVMYLKYRPIKHESRR